MSVLLSLAILLSGCIMTVRYGFVQKHLGKSFATVFEKETKGEISPFGALCTTLAATLGTGNIVGVAGAVALGGPGALFWMIFAALLGMALKYAECYAAVLTKGPFYYIETVLGKRAGQVFALCGAAAGSISIGTSLQMDSVIGVLDTQRQTGAFSFRSFIICIITALLAGWVLLGGAKGVVRFCEAVIPVLSIGYFLCCGVILWNFRAAIPEALLSIVKGAFCPTAVLGGAGGSILKTMTVGISRGVFSNEAGLGSAPIAAAAAGGSPHKQGLMAMCSVFLDTVVICFISGLCVVVTGAYAEPASARPEVLAFKTGLGSTGVKLLIVFLCIFAFTTIVGWYYFASACFRYLTHNRFETVFRIFYISMLLLAPFVQSERLWVLADTLNFGMALLNLTALLLLKFKKSRV